MRKERDKAKKICGQFIDIFFAHDIDDLSFAFEIENGLTEIDIQAELRGRTMDFDDLHKNLNSGRMPEYDNYYDELLGTGRDDGIRFVGYLVDSADLEVKDDILTIKLKRTHA